MCRDTSGDGKGAEIMAETRQRGYMRAYVLGWLTIERGRRGGDTG